MPKPRNPTQIACKRFCHPLQPAASCRCDSSSSKLDTYKRLIIYNWGRFHIINEVDVSSMAGLMPRNLVILWRTNRRNELFTVIIFLHALSSACALEISKKLEVASHTWRVEFRFRPPVPGGSSYLGPQVPQVPYLQHSNESPQTRTIGRIVVLLQIHGTNWMARCLDSLQTAKWFGNTSIHPLSI